MAASSLIVPVVDGIAKLLSDTHSPFMIAWARYAIAAAFVIPIGIRLYGWRLLPTTQITTHFTRTLCLVVAMTLFFVALQTTPLATALAAYFSGPIIALFLSIFLLKETITMRKTLSMCLGTLGALIILRPFAEIEGGIVLAFAAGGFFAIYIISTKMASDQSDPIKTLLFQCIVGTMLLTPQAAITYSAPSGDVLWLFVAMGAVSAAAHFLTIQAFRHAEASTLSPLVYLELIGAAAFGVIIFQDIPDLYTIVGAVLVAASGFILRVPQQIRPYHETNND